MKRKKLLVVLLGLFASSTSVWAQLDSKAQPFLDAYAASFEKAKVPGFAGKTLETMDMTICMTFYAASKPYTEKSCTRTAIDMTRRWMITETTGPFSTKTVCRDGKARMRIVGFEGPRELPKAQTKQLEQTCQAVFKYFKKLENGEFIFEGFESSHYDGHVRYGNVLAGEKVTATMVVPTLAIGQNAAKPAELQLIFDSDKTVIGLVISTPQGKALSVLTKPHSTNPLQRFTNMTYYVLEGHKPVRQATARLEQMKFNVPLNDALFELTSKR